MFESILTFLLGLRHVRLGPNTRLTFVFEHGVLITLGCLVLAFLGYLSYMPQSASPAKRRVLGVLRAALLVLVLLLACQPQLVMVTDIPQPAVVAVWIDSSTSMTLEDPYTGDKAAPMRAYLESLRNAGSAGAATSSQPVAGNAGRISRYNLAVATLQNARWLRDLTQTQHVLFFTGSGRAEAVGLATTPAEVDQRLAQIAAMKPQGNTTDVPTVLRDILDQVQGQRLSAVVLLSDGQTTEPGTRLDDAADKAQNAKIKVFAIAMGQEEEPFDVQITNMRVPEKTFTHDPISARVRVAGTGITRETKVRISIFRQKPDGGIDASAPLATREVTLDAQTREIETDVPVRLEKKDPGANEVFKLLTRVDPIGTTVEERTLENNKLVRSVDVLDAQINVLYVEGYPRWEFRYLKNELIREPTVNVSTLLLTADEGFVQDADKQVVDKDGKELFPGPLTHFPDRMEDMKKYNVLILGDVEPTYFSPLQQNLILDWVKKEGGGLCFIAGNGYNPETYRETPLEVLLPVTPDEIDPRARIMPPSDNSGYTLNVTAAGKDTNLFRFFDDPDLSWKQVSDLPQMFWYKPVQGLKPGSIVLATHASRSNAGSPAPMLVMRQFGAGPVIFSAYCDTWRWRRYTGEPLFQSYWLQMCRLLYANGKLGQDQRLVLATESNSVELGGQVKLSLTLKDPSLAGQMPPEVPVLVIDKASGRTVQTITLSRPPGDTLDKSALEKLTGSTTAVQIGDFSLEVKPGALPLAVKPQELTVALPQREFQEVTVDLPSLTAITGKLLKDPDVRGEVYFPNEQDDEKNPNKPSLERQIPDRSITSLNTISEAIWNKWIALLLVIGLATAEWLVRKSAGLI